jgi:DNA-binding protein HU-beta
MKKAEFVAAFQEKAGLSSKAQAEKAVDAFFSTLTGALVAGDSASFVGFGSFKVINRPARKGRNPQTGKEIDIPASKAVKFTPGKALKDSVK